MYSMRSNQDSQCAEYVYIRVYVLSVHCYGSL